jgi:hypothetical protein
MTSVPSWDFGLRGSLSNPITDTDSIPRSKRGRASVVVAFLLLFSLHLVATESQESAPEAWASLHYAAYIKTAFVRPEESAAFLREHPEIVTIRVFGDHQLESQVTLALDDSGKVEARMVTAAGSDLRNQLVALRAKMPSASTAEIFAAVRIARRRVSTKDLPTLRPELAKLKKLSVCAFPGNYLSFPGVHYQFWMNSGAGQYDLNFSWKVPYSQANSYWGEDGCGQAKLVVWARELFRLLNVETDARLGRRRDGR